MFENILSAWKIFRDVGGIDFVIQYFHYFFRELSMTEANTRKLITETGERIHAFNFIIFNNRPKKKKVKEPFLGNVEKKNNHKKNIFCLENFYLKIFFIFTLEIFFL